MAKQINFTHGNGTNYPESYWRITVLYVDVPNHYAKYIFTGYKDANARTDGRASIGEFTLEIRGDEFDIGFNKVTEKENNPQEIGYNYVMGYNTVPYDAVIDQGLETERVELRMKSFFDGALDV